MKKMFLSIVGLIVVTLSTVNVYVNSQNDRQSTLFQINASALTSESDWIAGMTTGTLTVGKITIPCCVDSVSTNSCDYGVIGCLTVGTSSN
jgi:3-polyprenyl-4-hydroxybenzoate decarboxylase